jgi:hypothetical protein
MLQHPLFAVFRPESALLHAFRGQHDSSSGLELALRYAARERRAPRPKSKLPRIAIYQDPLPGARVAKGYFGSGTVLLSQGLLSSFRDDEIVAVMQRGLELLSRRGTSVKTLCSSWSIEIEKSHRLHWTPLRALGLWTLQPLRSFLQRQDRKLNVFRAPGAFDSSAFASRDAAWRDALRKVSCSERIFS